MTFNSLFLTFSLFFVSHFTQVLLCFDMWYFGNRFVLGTINIPLTSKYLLYFVNGTFIIVHVAFISSSIFKSIWIWQVEEILNTCRRTFLSTLSNLHSCWIDLWPPIAILSIAVWCLSFRSNCFRSIGLLSKFISWHFWRYCTGWWRCFLVLLPPSQHTGCVKNKCRFTLWCYQSINQSILFDMHQTNGIINFKTYNTTKI